MPKRTRSEEAAVAFVQLGTFHFHALAAGVVDQNMGNTVYALYIMAATAHMARLKK